MFWKKKPKKEPPYLWVVPRPAQLLQNYPTNSGGQVPDGEAIAKFVTAVGYPCSLVKTTCGASVASYHLRLTDVRQIKKVDAAIPMLEAELNCTVIRSDSSVAHFALTIPRQQRETVHLKSVMESSEFRALSGAYTAENIYNANIPMCLGTDAEGKPLVVDLASIPHFIVSGATGAGKSVLVNSMITSTLFAKAPSQLKYVLIDNKEVEFSQFEGIPHLFENNLIRPQVITDVRTAIDTLSYMCQLMDERYTQLKQMGKRDIEGTQFARIVIVIDEFADVILTSKRAVEDYVCRLAQKGRAAGLHLIIATQQPRTAVLTGIIRANLPGRISLKTSTAIDSRISIGFNMAEKLLGMGDSIFVDPKSAGEFKRFQAAYISTQDIRLVCDYWKYNAKEYQQ